MATVEDAWKACGAVISGTEFREKADAFVDAHCEQFSDDEENKLEYTTIYEQYESLIEDKLQAGLSERLGSSFDWEGFLSQLPDYIQKIAGDRETEAVEKDDDELNASTLKVLYSFTDFDQFKAMMLLRKRSKSEPVQSDEVVAKEIHLDEELDAMVAMMHDGAWKTILKKPDLVVEMARNSKGVDTLRCTLQTGMPRANALDMWTNSTGERKNWDSNAEWVDHGTHHEIRVKVPLMSKPMKYVVKLVVKEEYPEKGSTVFAWRAVDPKTGQLDYSSGAPCGKGVIKDVAVGDDDNSNSNDCELTSIEELPSIMKYVPKFALNFLITSFTPSMIYGMLGKYKKYKGI